jgi:hypothetical protein
MAAMEFAPAGMAAMETRPNGNGDGASHSYEEITSDQKLLHAIDMYWEIRRLLVQVCNIYEKSDSDFIDDIGN